LVILFAPFSKDSNSPIKILSAFYDIHIIFFAKHFLGSYLQSLLTVKLKIGQNSSRGKENRTF
jgi:hypothetical protein